MSLNQSKSVLLRFSSSNTHHFNYFLNNAIIDSRSYHKDLGLILTNDLTWTNHYQHILSKAYKMLGLIRRSFGHSSSVLIKKLLYIAIVHSQVTYCSCLWQPHLLKNIALLEKLQRWTTKFILNDYSHLDYKNRLLSLNLLPLSMVLELNDLIFFIKSYQSPSNSFNIMNHLSFTSSHTRSGNYFKLQHTLSSNNSTRHFYFNCLPHLWNSLPPLDPNLPLSSLITKLKSIFYNKFIASFDSAITCTHHYLCPCNKCSLTTPINLYHNHLTSSPHFLFLSPLS